MIRVPIIGVISYRKLEHKKINEIFLILIFFFDPDEKFDRYRAECENRC